MTSNNIGRRLTFILNTLFEYKPKILIFRKLIRWWGNVVVELDCKGLAPYLTILQLYGSGHLFAFGVENRHIKLCFIEPMNGGVPKSQIVLE
jgi:hypothetical protein